MFTTLTRLIQRVRPKPTELAPDFKAGKNVSWFHRWNTYRNTPWRKLCLQSIIDECSETGSDRWLWAACTDALLNPEYDEAVDCALDEVEVDNQPAFDPNDTEL